MTAVIRPNRILGLYDKPYWDFVDKGELRLQRCTRCGHFRYPPSPVCPQCLSDEADWSKLSGRGQIASWTVFHRQYFKGMPAPYAVVSVATDEGPLLIGNMTSDCSVALNIGARVHAVFEDAQSEDGAKWRICQWRVDPD